MQTIRAFPMKWFDCFRPMCLNRSWTFPNAILMLVARYRWGPNVNRPVFVHLCPLLIGIWLHHFVDSPMWLAHRDHLLDLFSFLYWYHRGTNVALFGADTMHLETLIFPSAVAYHTWMMHCQCQQLSKIAQLHAVRLISWNSFRNSFFVLWSNGILRIPH